MHSARSSSRTTIVTAEACAPRKIAACPAELPPPTIVTGSPAQTWASISVAA